MERSGIYCIINNNNGKMYVGQSVHLSERIKQHFSELKRGKHPNKYLQRDFNKDAKFFTWKILELVDVRNLNEREKYWIEFYHTRNHKYGYNIQKVYDRAYTKDIEKYEDIN